MLTKMFTAKKIGTCEISNRFIVPAMVTNYCTEDGFITERYIAYIEEKAKGGFGLIITEDYAVNKNGKGYARIPGLYLDEQMEGNRELTKAVHRYNSKIFCQMYHPGRQSTPMVNGGVQPVAPSAIKDPALLSFPREMTRDEIAQLVKDFGEAAARAKESGFDGIEIHSGHGYLIAAFLSPFTNKRTDEYGGCFENRVRILDEIYRAIREAVGEEFPVIVRYSGIEYVPGGRTEAESLELALHLSDLGADALHISNGSYAADPLHQIIASMHTEHALNMDMARQVKELVDIPVIVTNRINDPGMAEMIVRSNKADFVGFGRGSIADPYLPEKTRAGKTEEINYCIGCLQGCATPIGMGGDVTCLVNPRVGREYENGLKPADKKKRVMVIGGGPAGLEVAITAAKRGHEVEVYEKEAYMGGQFRAAAYPLHKGELSTLVSSLRKNLEALEVPVTVNCEITEDIIKDKNPDVVILATGAKPMMPPIKGIDGKNVVAAEDVLYGKKDIGFGPVVVCGGGEVGGETAEFISSVNHNVTILEMQHGVMNDMSMLSKVLLMGSLQQRGVKIITGAKVSEIAADKVSYEDEEGNIISIPAETVVSAFGYKANNLIKDAAKKICSEVYVIGNAVKAGNAMTAMREGYETGSGI